VQYLNGGFWSPAFAEPDLKTRIGTQTFVWIRPSDTDDTREAALYEWPPGGSGPRPFRGELNRELEPAARADASSGERHAARISSTAGA
jgi:hypothetical protein